MQNLTAPEMSRCFIEAHRNVAGSPFRLRGDPLPAVLPDWAVELAAEAARQTLMAFCDKNGLKYPGPR